MFISTYLVLGLEDTNLEKAVPVLKKLVAQWIHNQFDVTMKGIVVVLPAFSCQLVFNDDIFTSVGGKNLYIYRYIYLLFSAPLSLSVEMITDGLD